MRTKINVIMLVFGLFLFSACSSDKETESLTAAQWQTLGGQKGLQILLASNKNDVQQIARILNCPVSPLKRVLKRQSFFTATGLKKIKGIVYQISVSKTASLDQMDPAKQTWAHKSDRFLTVESIVIRWLILIVGSLIIRAVGLSNVYPILLLYIGFIIVCKLYIYFYHYPTDPNLIKTSYDSFWEVKAVND